MKYLTEKEFEKEMTQIKQQKRQYEMRKELREAKRRFPKFKKPRTSKMVLWTVIAICIQILWFTEHMATITGDTSFMYALVAIPASLIPTVLALMNNQCTNALSLIFLYHIFHNNSFFYLVLLLFQPFCSYDYLFL